MFKTVTSETKRKSGSFLSGVLILTISTVLVKILGLFYRIPMLGLLGTEGMGYFNTAFELYALLGVTATAGLPVALSVRISADAAGGRFEEIRRLWKTALTVFLVIGVAGALALAVFCVPLAAFLKSDAARWSILAIAPALFFTCAAGALRGYFQGFGNMTPTAVSQLLEAAGKLVFGLIFASYAIHRGYSTEIVTAFALVGFCVATLISLVYLMGEKKRFSPEAAAVVTNPSAGSAPVSGRRMLIGLLALALPVTVSSSVVGLTRVVDMTMILRRLQTIGFDPVGANRLYGSYTTLALPVYHLVPSLITSVALPLLPSIAAAREAGDRQKESEVIASALRITALLAIPASFALAAFARPILDLLFHGQAAAVSESAPLLAVLGGSVFFSCLMTVAGAILQAYRKVMVPIWAMGVGILVKAISAYVFIGIPGIGIYGAPISTFLCGLAVTALELYSVVKSAPEGLRLRDLFLKPLFAAAPAVGATLALYLFLPTRLSGRMETVLLLGGCMLLYVGFAILTGAMTTDQIGEVMEKRRKQRPVKELPAGGIPVGGKEPN